MTITASILTFFLDLLFPRRCVRCGRDGGWACPTCLREAPILGRIDKQGSLEQVLACYDFANPLVRELVHNLKYNGITEIAALVVQLLSQGMTKGEVECVLGGGHPIALLPVPVSPARRRQRGYNQAEVVAQALGAWLDVPVWTGALRRRKGKSLVGKSAGARARQAEHAFQWAGVEIPTDVQTRRWVLVDDVYTTGSTLHTCAGILQEHTKIPVRAFVVAREY